MDDSKWENVMGLGHWEGTIPFCSISSELELGQMTVLIAWEAHKFSQVVAQ